MSPQWQAAFFTAAFLCFLFQTLWVAFREKDVDFIAAGLALATFVYMYNAWQLT